MTDAPEALFEVHRRHLFRLAYRMLGSVSEAEDIVQEAWIRWQAADLDAVANPRAFLSQTVTRLCLDQLKSARARRETYVGHGLPARLPDDNDRPDAALELADQVGLSLLLTLERLSPLERAAFLLHDMFDHDFDEVARLLDRSPEAVRQLAARARRHVRADRPRFTPATGAAKRLVEAFMTAARDGDELVLSKLLTEDAVLHSDGGGIRSSFPNVIHGRDRLVRLFESFARKGIWAIERIRSVGLINGAPGLISIEPDGAPQALVFELDGDRIARIYVVRNPEKLRHISRDLGL